jgi:hypothetical protein
MNIFKFIVVFSAISMPAFGMFTVAQRGFMVTRNGQKFCLNHAHSQSFEEQRKIVCLKQALWNYEQDLAKETFRAKTELYCGTVSISGGLLWQLLGVQIGPFIALTPVFLLSLSAFNAFYYLRHTEDVVEPLLRSIVQNKEEIRRLEPNKITSQFDAADKQELLAKITQLQAALHETQNKK